MKKLLHSLQIKLPQVWNKALGKIRKVFSTIKEKITSILTVIKNLAVFSKKVHSTSQDNVNNDYQLQSINKAEEFSLDECIDKAYMFKVEGDYLKAIQFYMHALDKKPSNDIVFWIILDICSLYKTMGKPDLAIYILEGYSEMYKDVMEDNVRNEIEKNLLVI